MSLHLLLKSTVVYHIFRQTLFSDFSGRQEPVVEGRLAQSRLHLGRQRHLCHGHSDVQEVERNSQMPKLKRPNCCRRWVIIFVSRKWTNLKWKL